jgi:hypothetical protein
MKLDLNNESGLFEKKCDKFLHKIYDGGCEDYVIGAELGFAKKEIDDIRCYEFPFRK